MPAFLLPLLSRVFSKTGLYVVAGVAVIAGALWFVHHERAIGEARCEAAVTAAKDAEQARETKINQDWQQWAEGANHNADVKKAEFDAVQKQIAVATAGDNRVCLAPDIVDRLRTIGKPGGQAAPNPAAAGPRR